jgi:hypothetical protein
LNGRVKDHLLPVGSTAVTRGVFNGRPWYEHAVRVTAADGSSVTWARWPGAAIRFMPALIEAVRTGNRELRFAGSDARAQGDWELADSVWQRTGVVGQVVSGRWFSVSRMFGPDGGLLCWYVNFERPPVWRPDGWDTNDLAVDLVVGPDHGWHWKDEDEYAHDRRLGLITDTEHAAVQAAREEAVALVEARADLFAASPHDRWLPDPSWPAPALRGC